MTAVEWALMLIALGCMAYGIKLAVAEYVRLSSEQAEFARFTRTLAAWADEPNEGPYDRTQEDEPW